MTCPPSRGGRGSGARRALRCTATARRRYVGAASRRQVPSGIRCEAAAKVTDAIPRANRSASSRSHRAATKDDAGGADAFAVSLASRSAVSLPRRSWSDKRSSFESSATPTSAAHVWEGIQTSWRLRSVSVAPKSRHTPARGERAAHLRCAPDWNARRVDKQSVRTCGSARQGTATACKRAQSSAA